MLRINFASQDKQLHSKEEIFYLQNGTTSEMWPFCCQMFPQKSLRGPYNIRKEEETLTSKNRKYQMFTQQTWVVLMELTNFGPIAPLEDSRKSGMGTSFSSFLTLLPAMVIF